jgi:hypothetical protein
VAGVSPAKAVVPRALARDEEALQCDLGQLNRGDCFSVLLCISAGNDGLVKPPTFNISLHDQVHTPSTHSTLHEASELFG